MAEKPGYWDGLLRRRVSRRRALQAAALGGAGLATATALSCENDAEEGIAPTLITAPGRPGDVTDTPTRRGQMD